MSAFDKVIGYESIKNELLQVSDMLQNRERYRALGAKLPQGILLYGEPGLGKTLMAKCFIEECGLPAYTVRRNTSSKEFIKALKAAFDTAAKNAPAVIFLDDMDKFANEDDNHTDAEEYVTVQACIDEVKGRDVLVLATVNDMHKLPRSLRRPGRFDLSIEVEAPEAEDAAKIIAYYLSDKRLSENVNVDDFCKMVSYQSCAELETILNNAAVSAGFARRDKIETEDLVRAALRLQYSDPDDCMDCSNENVHEMALHEAGHLVVSEVLCPGSIGFATLRFIHHSKVSRRRPYEIMVALAGKAAAELSDAEHCANGCMSDLNKAVEMIRDGMASNATYGFGLLDVESHSSPAMSQLSNYTAEAAVRMELERYLRVTRDILLKNREFLDAAAAALEKKGTLLFSEIQAMRNQFTIALPTAV